MAPVFQFIIFFFLLLLFASTHVVYALNADGVTLLLLSRHLKLPQSIEFSWNSSEPTPCKWQGIHCDHKHHVISLNMSSSNILGALGKEIGGLKYLQTIDLHDNNLSGVIPLELGNCSQLLDIDLSVNTFTREIPLTLVNLRQLRSLFLYDNSLSGMIHESLFQIPHLQLVLLNDNEFAGLIPSNVGNLTELKSLWLYYNKFSGTIPSSIGNCSKLEELYLNDNQLVGNLPASLNNLEFLAFLILSFNRFLGEIPDLSYCTSLIEFAAVNNSFSGNIPSSLGLLTELSLLYLSGNSLSGKIPPEIGNCSFLTELELYENQLQGIIPTELGLLRNLQKLWLYTNQLSGEFPAVIWRIPTLRSVIIYGNNLSGELPLEITALHELTTILLYENQFSGAIPQSLGINSSLENLDFTNNKLIGEIPPNLCFGKQLRFLNLGLNQLHGSMPSDIGSCSTLQRLILRQNSLIGPLPEFAENSSISFMDISGNSINGSLPSSLGNCANLSSINLSNNKLTGLIPEDLGNLVKLQVLNLSLNNLQGPLPLQIARCVQLYSLDLGFNTLNGSIPATLRSLTSLSRLILRQNQFTGEIPDIFPPASRLRELQLGGNLLVGEIPSSIGQLQNLAYGLNLSDNNLIGRLPPEMGRLIMVERLDISWNKLTGSLAVLDELRSLLEVNVSHNQFEGPIPDTLLKFLNSSPFSFSDNGGLCYLCQSRGGLACSENNGLSPCEKLSSNPKKGINRVTVVVIAVGSLVLCVVVLAVLGYYIRKSRNSEDQEFDTFSRVGSSIQLRMILKATEGLNERYIIGRGAHGIVYKVSLGPDKCYAVKKLEFESSNGASASMVREIQTVGKIRHRNLVKVKDFWFKKDHGLILYKYMPNGSLHSVLHEGSPAPTMKWDVRYRIALGIAQGLEYLHNDSDPIIIHRDIKPKNILLDSEMEPHISDFGIAKLIEQSSASSDSVSVVGTVGYLAPETAYTTIWSMESDVYSYGVVLLELLTRKQAVDSSFQEGIEIVGWACSKWNSTKSIIGIVDTSLMEVLDSNGVKEVIEVFLVALRCTARQPNERPTMRDVVKHLTDIKAGTLSTQTSM